MEGRTRLELLLPIDFLYLYHVLPNWNDQLNMLNHYTRLVQECRSLPQNYPPFHQAAIDLIALELEQARIMMWEGIDSII